MQFGGCLFHQVTGIPVEMNCASLLADLFLYSERISRQYDQNWPQEAISILCNQSATWATSVRNGDIVGNSDMVGNGDINFVTPLS